ncbi:hypothetical protein GOV11_00585 [Candidatus Woesearchaeota archaeon]|nr:hypothetical protein [Candidatus Woesearchaeota archaeon]
MVKYIPDEDELTLLFGYLNAIGVGPRKDESLNEFKKRVAEVLYSLEDPLQAVEILTGKDYNESSNLGLGLAFVHIQAHAKANIARSRNDIYRNMPWDDLEKCLESNGFRKGTSQTVKKHSNKYTDEYALWYDLDRGILATAESHNRKRINKVIIHYELDLGMPSDYLPKDSMKKFINLLSSRSESSESYRPMGEEDYRIVCMTENVLDDGMVDHLDYLESTPFSFVSPWQRLKDHYLWLVNYAEEKELDFVNRKDFSYDEIDEITYEKLWKLPSEAKEMIGLVEN